MLHTHTYLLYTISGDNRKVSFWKKSHSGGCIKRSRTGAHPTCFTPARVLGQDFRCLQHQRIPDKFTVRLVPLMNVTTSRTTLRCVLRNANSSQQYNVDVWPFCVLAWWAVLSPAHDTKGLARSHNRGYFQTWRAQKRARACQLVSDSCYVQAKQLASARDGKWEIAWG